MPPRPERRVEIPRLRDAIRPHQRFPNHEDLVRVRQLRELLQIRHQPRVVVPAPRRVDKHDVELLRGRVRDGIFGNIGGVLAVALLEKLDLATALALRELLEVAGVNPQLLHSAGAEGVAGGDEDLEIVLEEEEGEFGEIGGLADAVDADDGDDVRAPGRGEWI